MYLGLLLTGFGAWGLEGLCFGVACFGRSWCMAWLAGMFPFILAVRNRDSNGVLESLFRTVYKGEHPICFTPAMISSKLHDAPNIAPA